MNFFLRYFSNLYAGIAVPLGLALRHAGLLQMLVKRDFVNRSSGTLLGRVWPVLQPAMQMVGFWFLFDVVYGLRTGNQNQDGPSFLTYLISGMLPWFCISEVLNRASGMFREFSNLFRRSAFPVEILPVLIMLVPGIVYSLVYALVCLVLFGVVSALVALLVIPLLLLWLLPLIYLFSVLGVFVRDFAQALPILLMFLMYATPILYFPAMLPETAHALLWLNPFADLLRCIHAVVETSALPMNSIYRLMAIWLLLLAPAWLVYRRSLPHVREVL